MYVVYSICLYFFVDFFCSHTIKIIFPKKCTQSIEGNKTVCLGSLHTDHY